MNITSDTRVTDAELAALVGVEARQIRRYAEAGILDRAERGRYLLGPSIRALMEEAAGSGSALTRARTRKVEAEATQAELALAIARSEVCLVSEHLAAQNTFAGLVRLNIMNVPQRACLRLLAETNETTFKRVLREELITALAQARDDIAKQPTTTEGAEHD